MRQYDHRLTVITEPPGLASKYESHYAFLDLFSLPIGRVLQGLSKVTGFCLFNNDVISGSEPQEEREWHSYAYEQLFRTQFQDATVINLFKELCENRADGEGFKCQIPRGVVVKGAPTETEYKRDLLHLSSSSSYWLQNLIEKGVFGSKKAVSAT